MTVPSTDVRTITLRIPSSLAAGVGLCTRLDGVSAAALAIGALQDAITVKLADPATQARLRALHEAELETLQKESRGTVDLPHGGES